MIDKLHDKYGFDAMREIWIEELLELATILQQSKRKDIYKDDIIDEIADVSFCVDQMTHLYGEDQCNDRKDFKIQRTIDRLL